MRTLRLEKTDMDEVVRVLKKGGIVAFPTDTVYGLGAMYGNHHALNALKKAKGRPESKPIPIMIATMDQLYEIAQVNDVAKKLADALMPGALTLILKKQEKVSNEMTNGFDTVAVRMSEDPFVQTLITRLGCPLLVSSANRSDELPGVNDVEVLKQLDGRIDAIVKGEVLGSIPSTIVDVTQETITIVRKGMIEETAISAVLKKEEENK